MSAITDASQTALDDRRAGMHPLCVVCSRSNECGLKLDFDVCEDGSVRATFDCPRRYEGYHGLLHGGVTSSLLDGAMTHALFARNIGAVTAELKVRFRHPVRVESAVTVRAWISRASSPLYVLKAELIQDGQLRATADGKFMETPINQEDG